MEREKLQKQLDTERARRELVEWLLAKREWQLSLALDCSDVSASAFAATVQASEMPDPDELVSDRDAANLVGVSPSTIRVWAHREAGNEKPAIARYVSDDGSTVYRAGEVLPHAMAMSGGRGATTRRLNNMRRAGS